MENYILHMVKYNLIGSQKFPLSMPNILHGTLSEHPSHATNGDRKPTEK